MDSRVQNSGRKSEREAKNYWHSKVRYDGKIYHLLLTDTEVNRGIDRMNKNPEDYPSLWKRLRLTFGI
tara:strand:+ start:517 stop:720 length:204 start_codon:yes stop_codon:yes gene_type:complete